MTNEFVAGGIECAGGSDYAVKSDLESVATNAGTAGGAASADTAISREDALETAKRELEEETGYTSDDWSHMITVPSNATISDNYAFVYRAKNCRRTHEQHTDSTEFLHLRLLSAEEIDSLIQKGQFQQAIHIMAWLMAKEAERGH